MAGKKLRYFIPLLRLKKTVIWQTACNTCLIDQRKQYFVCVLCLAPAFQNRTVTTLDAEGRNLYQRIRPCLKNHTNHTDWTAFPDKCKSLVQLTHKLRLIDFVRQGNQVFYPPRHIRKLLSSKLQPLYNRVRNIVFFRFLQILLICLKNLLLMCDQCFCYLFECTISYLCGLRCHKCTVQFHCCRFFLYRHVKTSRLITSIIRTK